jgi:hypothetical protein
MKRIFAITHAEKKEGVNPGLTDKGMDDLIALIPKLPCNIRNVIIGTGKRFHDIFRAIAHSEQLCIIWSVKFSPLLGSADSGTETETGMDVYLADGTLVKIGDYIGLIGTPGVDPWKWLNSLQDNTLLCTGREFIGALGVKDAKMATIYVIDVDASTLTVTEVG